MYMIKRIIKRSKNRYFGYSIFPAKTATSLGRHVRIDPGTPSVMAAFNRFRAHFRCHHRLPSSLSPEPLPV